MTPAVGAGLIVGAFGLATVAAAAAGAVRPARALSAPAARALLSDWARDGDIELSEARVPERVTMAPTVGGVRFQYQGRDRVVNDVDPRMAVLLVRLARRVRQLGAVAIAHLGIYPGNPARPHDCHNEGRAIDLAGVTFADGVELDVLRDWGEQPAPYDVATSEASTFRLTAGRAARVFQSLYDFATEQASDSAPTFAVRQARTRIGEHSYIVTPDHPTPRLRARHQDHMHIQIGPT